MLAARGVAVQGSLPSVSKPQVTPAAPPAALRRSMRSRATAPTAPTARPLSLVPLCLQPLRLPAVPSRQQVAAETRQPTSSGCKAVRLSRPGWVLSRVGAVQGGCSPLQGVQARQPPAAPAQGLSGRRGGDTESREARGRPRGPAATGAATGSTTGSALIPANFTSGKVLGWVDVFAILG